MCKLMIMSGITDETQDHAWMFVKEMSKQMSNPHCTESDGLGYAAIDPEGKLYGERWVRNSEAFQHKNPYGSDVDSNILKNFKILSRDKVYGSFGVLSPSFRSITLHSRMSTNIVNYKNTHPFIEGTTSLIHNGVINNDHKLTKKTSSCDSEVILHEYIKYNIANKPERFQKVANKLEGYYALGIFAQTSQGLPVLDVIRDNSAKLDAFFIKELNTIVFATPAWTKNPVEEACKSLWFTIVSKYEVKANRLQRLNALTGETIAYESFKAKERYTTTYTPTYNGYDSRANQSYLSRQEKFDDVFKKESNVTDMTTHTHKKGLDSLKERILNEMVLGNTEYKQSEVKKLISESHEITKKFEEKTWTEDDRFVWKKSNRS